jgi:putative glutathione S-transferase
MMSTGFGELASDAVDLVPAEHRGEIDALNRRTYETVNNAVYLAPATGVYEHVVRELFAKLDELLATRRCLFGDTSVETD